MSAKPSARAGRGRLTHDSGRYCGLSGTTEKGRECEFARQKSCRSGGFADEGQLTGALLTDSANRSNDRKGREPEVSRVTMFELRDQ